MKPAVAPTEDRPNPHAATEAAAWPPVQPSAPVEYTPPAYGFQPPAVRAETARATTTHARGPRRLSMWLLLVMVGLAVGIVVVALAMSPTPKRREPARVATPGPGTAATAPPPAATARATTATATVIAPPVQPPKEPTAPAVNRPSSRPPHADAGTEDASPNVGFPGLPPFPFPLPSAFPFPSALPLPLPLPSGFPPFGLPGFPQPAPAGSQ